MEFPKPHFRDSDLVGMSSLLVCIFLELYIDLSYDSDSTLDIYLREIKHIHPYINLYTHIHCGIITTTRNWNNSNVHQLTNEQTKCDMEWYLAIKSNEVLIHVTTDIDFENVMLNERNQTQSYILYDFSLYKISKIVIYI